LGFGDASGTHPSFTEYQWPASRSGSGSRLARSPPAGLTFKAT
jgi:hypothetical protein